MQMTIIGRGYEQHSDDIDCQPAQNRCPVAPSDGGIDDELCQRPYRCHLCRVGFKLKVIDALFLLRLSFWPVRLELDLTFSPPNLRARSVDLHQTLFDGDPDLKNRSEVSKNTPPPKKTTAQNIKISTRFQTTSRFYDLIANFPERHTVGDKGSVPTDHQ